MAEPTPAVTPQRFKVRGGRAVHRAEGLARNWQFVVALCGAYELVDAATKRASDGPTTCAKCLLKEASIG